MLSKKVLLLKENLKKIKVVKFISLQYRNELKEMLKMSGTRLCCCMKNISKIRLPNKLGFPQNYHIFGTIFCELLRMKRMNTYCAIIEKNIMLGYF